MMKSNNKNKITPVISRSSPKRVASLEAAQTRYLVTGPTSGNTCRRERVSWSTLQPLRLCIPSQCSPPLTECGLLQLHHKVSGEELVIVEVVYGVELRGGDAVLQRPVLGWGEG